MTAKKRKTGRPGRKKAAGSRTAESRTAESRTAESRTAEPRTAEPRTAESRTAKPRTAEPVFWFGFEMAWAKVVLARVVVFGLLAIDALLQIRHAPRYGAGGFNVAQLPGLDALSPGRALHVIAELTNAYLLVLAACGVATRAVLPAVTAIYAWLYFTSQLDSYQHHYLVALLLLLACFVPWQRPREATPATKVTSWALRLVLVELAILYLWAAVSKMNAAWVSGLVLGKQITGTLRSLIDATIGIRGASCVVLGTELVLAATIWSRRTWIVALPLGLGLHFGILASGLEIGLFAWLMLALYVLVVPDRVWVWLAETPPVRLVRAAAGKVRAPDHALVVTAVGLAAGIAVVLACRFPDSLGVAIAISVAVAAAAIVRRMRGAALAWLMTAHVLAFGLWTFVDRTSSLTEDYYRLWGGNARRLGDRDGARVAYGHLVELAPDDANAHYHLATLLLANDSADDGLAELHEAERLDPEHARALVAEGRWLLAHGRRDEALVKARAAIQAEPADRDARDLEKALQK